MTVFIRKNIVMFSFVFTANDGSTTQPSAATVVLSYKDQGGNSKEGSIPLVYSSATNAWSGTWDTSYSGEGDVYWMVYGYGTLQAADQGQFWVSANAANTV